jgi:hypothetical protein
MGGIGMNQAISTEILAAAYPYNYADLKRTKNQQEK